LILQGRNQQMAALRAENVRLRSLLNSSTLLQSDVLVAELIGVVADRQRHLVILNKGARDGVFVGQPLLDADGLMGQIVQVSERSARALLITDVTHSVPLQVNRNAVRVIAEGTGLLDVLELRHVVATTDIEVGDLLVTSGLGGRFPAGYPVATVTSVERDPGQTFVRVVATPNAALNRSRHVLLVFSTRSGNEQPTAADVVPDG
jgi:rod shape-determining protein MreC